MLERLLALLFLYPYRCQSCGRRFWRMKRGAPPTRVPVERRDFDRHRINIPVTIQTMKGRFDAVATDISIAGCALESGAGVPTNAPFAVTLHVGSTPIEIAAARARYAEGQVTGVEFRQIAPSMQKRLAEYVLALFTPRRP